MKNRIWKGLWGLLAVLTMVACEPQENDDHSLGRTDTVSPEQVVFTQKASTTSDNVITFTSQVELDSPYSLLWNLGNGSTSKAKTVTTQYPMAGDYNVSLTIYTADGVAATKTMVLHIANNDFSLIDTKAYRDLTGGMENPAGKVWVLDQYNNFSKEVANATGRDIRGHLGLSPLGSYSQEWYGAGPDEKAPWKLYNFRMTFIQDGVRLKIENAGYGYGRKAVVNSLGGFNIVELDGEDATFEYSGGNYTFSLNESGTYPVLTLSDNAVMGYYCGTQDLEIFYQTDKVMAVRMANTTEGQDWVLVFCLEELNVSTPAIVKEPKAIPLNDTFEENSLAWVAEEMGDKSGIKDNPASVPVNQSDKVYHYVKSTSFYSNLSFTAPTYTFDLSKQNKIRLKVFIPSFNDYTTEYDVAGDWIANNKLLSQLTVKLQDSSMGGNAWQTQVEVVKTNLQKDKWLELEYDFSHVKDRKELDKIIVQFGAEGHAGAGIFYFDDFTFGE